MDKHERRPTRLRGYDYNQPGAYFITICTKDRARLLSRICMVNGCAAIELLECGKIVQSQIQRMNACYAHLRVEKYVIMPDHVHLILTLLDSAPENASLEPKNSAVAKFVGTFKRFCNKECGQAIWQARSYDHIIRDQEDYNVRWEYIENNPMNWILTGKVHVTPSP